MSDARCSRTSAHSCHSGLICATHDSESRDRRVCGSASCPAACRESCHLHAPHARTHARTHASACTRAVGALTHQGSRVHEGRLPPHGAAILRLPTSAPGLGSPHAHLHSASTLPLLCICSGTALPPWHHYFVRALPHLHQDGAHPLPTSATGLDSTNAHVCAMIGLSHCRQLQWDWAHRVSTSAPGLGSPSANICPGLPSPTAHICTGTALSHCPHLRRDWAHPLPTSAPGLGSPTAP